MDGIFIPIRTGWTNELGCCSPPLSAWSATACRRAPRHSVRGRASLIQRAYGGQTSYGSPATWSGARPRPHLLHPHLRTTLRRGHIHAAPPSSWEVQSLPESRPLPSARSFAECFLSDTRQRLLCREPHSATSYTR
jgi:hypothetical protein